jgi:hypothetical protein
VWAKTTNGKSIPLDARRNGAGQLVPAEFEDGNLADTGQVGYGHKGALVPVVMYAKPGLRQWRTHFASCPNSQAHRRRT